MVTSNEKPERGLEDDIIELARKLHAVSIATKGRMTLAYAYSRYAKSGTPPEALVELARQFHPMIWGYREGPKA